MRTAEQLGRELMDASLSGDWDRMRGLCHPDYVFTTNDGRQRQGPESLIKSTQRFIEAVPGLRVEGSYHAVSETLCVLEGYARGVHLNDLSGVPPTNNEIAIRMVLIFESRDGLLIRQAEYLDSAAMWREFGVATQLQLNGQPLPV